MTFEQAFKNIAQRETELQPVYRSLQSKTDDYKSKQVLSDLDKHISKDLKFIHEIKIKELKSGEWVSSFEMEQPGSEIPRYDGGVDETVNQMIDSLLTYEKRLRVYYQRIKNSPLDAKTKRLFDDLARFKKIRIRQLEELKEEQGSIV